MICFYLYDEGFFINTPEDVFRQVVGTISFVCDVNISKWDPYTHGRKRKTYSFDVNGREKVFGYCTFLPD